MSNQSPLRLQRLPETPLHGPIEVSMKVHCVIPDGSSAVMTVFFEPGRIPTNEELRDVLNADLSTAKSIPRGSRLMQKPEFVRHITKRDTGQEMDMPGCQTWEPGEDESREMLIRAIIGCGFQSHELADYYEKVGLAKFTGNQHNESWSWRYDELSKLDSGSLRTIYEKVKRA